jgi:IclR family transcriptional regulator, acetate operon repressor
VRTIAAPTTSPVSYLGRCLGLLECLSSVPNDGLTLSELAERAAVPVSTASRLTQLLEERGLAFRLPNRRYVPGSALLMLGLRSLRRLPTERYRPALRALSEATGESVSVGLVVGDEIVLVARQESQHRLRVVAAVGDVIPPHRSAMGKAILAHVGAGRRQGLLAAAVGEHARTVGAELDAELERAAFEGFARDEEVFAIGLRCIAAPLLGSDGEAVGAISIAGPTARFGRDVAESFVPALVEQTRMLSLASALEPVL